MPAAGLPLERTAEILAELGILLDDRPLPLDAWLDRKLADIAPGFADEAGQWARALRDGASRQPARHPETARHYTNAIHPILLAWSATYDHPREVTREDVKAALDTPHGEPRMTALVALR
jgi:hypothetical protein